MDLIIPRRSSYCPNFATAPQVPRIIGELGRVPMHHNTVYNGLSDNVEFKLKLSNSIP
jgi:hypothetical protein